MPSTPEKDVVIIGAGIGGLSLAIALKKRFPTASFTIYEKDDGIGGTWQKNTYPGSASDVPIHFYSLSTELKHDWTTRRGMQPDILAYWKDLSHKYRLHERTVINTAVVGANWHTEGQRWNVSMKDLKTGAVSHITARILVSAAGFLDIPNYPSFQGREKFKGDVFHSARWNHSIDLSGKRVGVIGNGASATQFLPVIAKDPTTDVTSFCRTPVWYVDSLNHPIKKIEKLAFRWVPFANRLYRMYRYFQIELLYTLFAFPKARKIGMKSLAAWMLAKSPEKYHDKLIPQYDFGCRRIAVGNEVLDTLHQENFRLNWEGISELTEEGIRTKTGEDIPLDVIIFATGFITNEYPIPITGTQGTLQEYWKSKEGPTAYLGTTLPNFPNFMMLAGPNTITGHTSVIFTEECQINYSMQLMQPIFDGLASSYTVTTAAADAYDEDIKARLKDSVYTQCVSWYRQGGNGKVTMTFPGPVALFWWWLRKVDWKHYECVGEVKESVWEWSIRVVFGWGKRRTVKTE